MSGSGYCNGSSRDQSRGVGTDRLELGGVGACANARVALTTPTVAERNVLRSTISGTSHNGPPPTFARRATVGRKGGPYVPSRLDSTNGASLTCGAFLLAATRYHSRADARMTTHTIAMKNSASAASTRSLKIMRAAPGAVLVASDAACDRNPSFGSGENTFCHPAVSVAAVSHTSGRIGTHEYRIFPILIRIVAATQSATAASN